jgi:hypothetical protein
VLFWDQEASNLKQDVLNLKGEDTGEPRVIVLAALGLLAV